MKKRVVITGMGVVAPNGTGVENFLHSIQNGVSGIRFIEELKNLNFGCQIGGIPEFNDSPYLQILEQYGLNGCSKIITLSCIAGLEAWEDAGFQIPERESAVDYETGIIIGSGIGSADIFGERIVPLTNEKQIKKLRSTIVEHSMLSGPSANLAGILGLGNQITFNSSACSTGTEAILMSFERIRSGQAISMIAGAADTYSPYCWSGFDSMRVLTRKYNEEPEKGSRPMSESASGFVPGAGAGIIILEEYETAIKRNAKIYGEIVGGHINAGGQRSGGTMSAPNSEGVIRCIKNAMKDACIESKQIDYISGHLSSTMADPIEIKNWTEALGRQGNEFPYINSLKSMTGHTIGAAGAIETVAALLQMNHNFIHPSLNCEDLHPEIKKLVAPEKIPHTTINDIKIKYLAKSSFGFGDVNACVIIKNLKD